MSFNNFKAALHDLFENQENCDVTFICNEPTETESMIKAHKLVLSVASDVFRAMFYGEAVKHESFKNKEEPINIDDIKMPIFKLFLSFIYTKLVDFKTTEMAAEFYYAAHKYNVLDALEFIKAYMLKEVKAENAVVLCGIACLYENQELKDACLKIFSENTSELITSPAFLKADPKTVEEFFKLNTLNIDSETQLIKALERYIAHNRADNSDIAEKVRPALNQIRFLTLAAPVIAQTTLLNPIEAMQVVACLSSDDINSKMPPCLSTNKQKRIFTTTVMEMARKLSQSYSDKYCNYCVANRTSNHIYWNCQVMRQYYLSNYRSPTSHQELNDIYQKYKHVWLLDYDLKDLKTVYQIYKQLGLLN